MISNLITPDLYLGRPGFKCSASTGYPDRFSFLWSSIPPTRCRNGTSNQATTTSFHTLFNSLFTTDPIIGMFLPSFSLLKMLVNGGGGDNLHSFIYQTMQRLY